MKLIPLTDSWLMDACIRDRYLDNRRLAEMGNILDSAELARGREEKGKAQPEEVKVKFTFGAAQNHFRNQMVVHRRFLGVQIEEVVEPAETILGDMGMILRSSRVSFALHGQYERYNSS